VIWRGSAQDDRANHQLDVRAPMQIVTMQVTAKIATPIQTISKSPLPIFLCQLAIQKQKAPVSRGGARLC
jgi:hypothetical protein